ncbi:stathmin-2b isoform 3-T5 [Syngnathus typhle]
MSRYVIRARRHTETPATCFLWLITKQQADRQPHFVFADSVPWHQLCLSLRTSSSSNSNSSSSSSSSSSPALCKWPRPQLAIMPGEKRSLLVDRLGESQMGIKKCLESTPGVHAQERVQCFQVDLWHSPPSQAIRFNLLWCICFEICRTSSFK